MQTMTSVSEAGSGSESNQYFGQYDKKADCEESVKLYEGWAQDYEKNLLGMKHGYSHPKKIACVTATYVADKGSRILDLCAGTGLGGVALKELGFTNIDALDGSGKMLELAKEKNVYRHFFEEIVGHDQIRSAPPGSYDAVVTSGSFVPGHLDAKHLQPIIDSLKAGGYFFMAMRSSYLQSECLNDLEPTMQQLEASGKWKLISRSSMEHYFDDLPGTVFVFRKV